MHHGFVLKVGDLLRDPSRLDRIEFEGLILEDVSGLTSEGYSGILSLQGVTDGSVKLTIQEAHASIQELCDLSGEEYQKQVEVKNFTVRFSEDEEFSELRVYDDVFPLDAVSESIDIYDVLVQSILIQEPLVHIKPGKEYLLDEYEDDGSENVEKGNVRFH